MSANQQVLAGNRTSDSIPDAFNFTDQSGAALSTVITSNTITPTGYNTSTSWTCSGGTASISGGAYTNSGTISPGQTVSLRLTSSSANSTVTSATLNINGVSDTWNVTTLAAISGQVEYTSPGTYSWICPAGVTSVSVVCVGGGGWGNFSGTLLHGGGGGALAYTNNISVTPGNSYTVITGNVGEDSSFYVGATPMVVAGRGQSGAATGGAGGVVYVGSGGSGGAGGSGQDDYYTPGGGGAGGYLGSGGYGGPGVVGSSVGSAGAGGGGGGGGSFSGGGGVGIYGQGASGAMSLNQAGGFGGSGGTNGTSLVQGGNASAGLYGGGTGTSTSTLAGTGAVRIIWPGNSRQFPANRTANE